MYKKGKELFLYYKDGSLEGIKNDGKWSAPLPGSVISEGLLLDMKDLLLFTKLFSMLLAY